MRRVETYNYRSAIASVNEHCLYTWREIGLETVMTYCDAVFALPTIYDAEKTCHDSNEEKKRRARRHE